MTPSDHVSTHPQDAFASRHIGPDTNDRAHMMATIGIDSVEELIAQAVPGNILMTEPLALAQARSESEVLAALRELADANTLRTSLIGLGYYGTRPALRRLQSSSPSTSPTKQHPPGSIPKLKLSNFCAERLSQPGFDGVPL